MLKTAPGKKQIRSMRGKVVDMELLRKRNELTPAVGNARVNARGDELGPNGTAIEGDWDEVFECVRKCHEKIHSKGAPRIYTTMKVNTRTDKEQKFSDKVRSVLEK